MSVEERVRQVGVIPVVSIPRPEHALPLAEALLEGGLPCAEITFRTAAAEASIRQIKERFPEIFLGAGTVLSEAQAQTALDAGAEFIVSPGTNPAVVDYCRARGVTIFPGVCTPTEVEQALARGAEVLKFFPAEAMGGVKFLKAICAPYGGARFIPTGGIEPANLGHYLALPQVVACGGSWMVKPEWLAAGDFARVREAAREAAALVRSIHEGDEGKQR
jgi:2-dehydro-3-deoxyphosphogluconate aldolase / (4S)-4-hydroxy-2-oxoglutarate aldolase